MKKSLLFICLMAISLCSWAQENGHETTTDHISLDAALLTLGGSAVDVSFNLVGEGEYTALGMNIVLPEGYTWGLNRRGNLAVTIDVSDDSDLFDNTFSYGANVQSDGSLIITVSSSESRPFYDTNGLIFKIAIQATSYAKPGPVAIQIKDCFFVTTAGIQYDTDDITISDKVSASNNSTVPVSVSAEAKWATCILPFASAVPSGVKAYTCDSKDENNLLLTEAASLAAYTPYILYSESGYSGNLSGTVDPSQYPAEGYVKSGYLYGAIVPQTVNDGYVLQNLSEGVKFYSCGGDNFNIPAGKCWVNVGGGAAKARYGFAIMGSETGINNINATENADAMFTISGMRVKNAVAPGIYVVNNKKVIVNK